MDADAHPVGPASPQTFRSTLDRFGGEGAPHYFRIPAEVALALGRQGGGTPAGPAKQGTRLRVTVDGRFTDHLALRRRGEIYFVSAGEKMRRRCRLVIGTTAMVRIEPDDSPHGIPVPKVLREVLRYDEEAGGAFAKLSPGARRTLITRVRKGRTREGRIRIALAVADELCDRPRGTSRAALL